MNSSFKAGKRDIKLALSTNSNSAEANVLKANLEYLKANYRKSLKLLQTAYHTVQAARPQCLLNPVMCAS